MPKKKTTEPLAKRLTRERDALKKLLDDKLAVLRALREQGAESFDRQWEIVGEILEHDPPLWQGRYTSEVKFVAAELPDTPRREVARNVLVAGAFRPQDLAQHPITLLEELALYVKEKAGMTERPRALDLSRVVVETASGDRVKGDRVTLDQVKAARRKLGKKTRAKDGPRAAVVRKALAKRKALSKLTVAITEQHATFTRVPLDELGSLAKALSALKLPRPPK